MTRSLRVYSFGQLDGWAGFFSSFLTRFGIRLDFNSSYNVGYICSGAETPSNDSPLLITILIDIIKYNRARDNRGLSVNTLCLL